MISINGLVNLISNIAEVKITKKYVPGPQGVRGRNSDNTLLRKVLGWEPKIPLEDGLQITYCWIEQQARNTLEHNGSKRLEAAAA
jgi:GDP-D-mannose 3',5'-epimerase